MWGMPPLPWLSTLQRHHWCLFLFMVNYFLPNSLYGSLWAPPSEALLICLGMLLWWAHVLRSVWLALGLGIDPALFFHFWGRDHLHSLYQVSHLLLSALFLAFCFLKIIKLVYCVYVCVCMCVCGALVSENSCGGQWRSSLFLLCSLFKAGSLCGSLMLNTG